MHAYYTTDEDSWIDIEMLIGEFKEIIKQEYLHVHYTTDTQWMFVSILFSYLYLCHLLIMLGLDY